MVAIALVGLSGVGKSTFLKKLRTQVEFLHLGASDLIKSELAHRQKTVLSSEELRLGPVIANQELLIDGFLREVGKATLPIVFDGHVLIDGLQGVTEIPRFVFERIGIKYLVVLQDDPHLINVRRGFDHSRSRPHRTDLELAAQQDRTIILSATMARALSINMIAITPSQPELLVSIISERW